LKPLEIEESRLFYFKNNCIDLGKRIAKA